MSRPLTKEELALERAEAIARRDAHEKEASAPPSRPKRMGSLGVGRRTRRTDRPLGDHRPPESLT